MLDDESPYDDPGSPATAYIAAELFGSPQDNAVTTLAWATVGHEGVTDVADKGDGTDTEDGVTLIRVTMHAGAPPGEPASPSGAANGLQVLAMPPMFPQWIPRRGTRCLLGYPDGPTGMPVILAYYGVAPTKQYGKNTAKLDFGDQDLVITAKSITLRDSADNLVAISPDAGFSAVDSSGSGYLAYAGTIMLRSIDTTGATRTFLSLDSEVVQAVHATAGLGLKLKGDTVSINGVNVCINYMGALNLGMKASPATRVMVGAGPAPAAVASQSIFGSP